MRPVAQPPGGNKKGKRLGIIIVAIIVVLALIAGGAYYFLAGKEEKKPAKKAAKQVTLTSGIKSQWSSKIEMKRGDGNSGAKGAYAIYNKDQKVLFVFTLNQKDWKVTALDQATGKAVEKNIPASLPKCDNDLEHPFTIANGKIECSKPQDSSSADKPADSAKPDEGNASDSGNKDQGKPTDSKPSGEKGKLPEHSVPIFTNDQVTIVALPKPDAAQAIAGYKPDGTLIWVEAFDKPAVVGTDGIVAWAITENEDGTEATVGFFTGSSEPQKDPKLPEIKVLPKDFLKSFDFKNTFMPGVGKGIQRSSCDYFLMATKEGEKKLLPIPDKLRNCFVKVTDGISKDVIWDAPEDHNAPEVEVSRVEYEDYNGDGYLDALITGGFGGGTGQFLAIANPDDPNHPWITLLYFDLGPGAKYQGNGTWVTDVLYRLKISLRMDGKQPVLVYQNR